jgi:hypothetical protein
VEAMARTIKRPADRKELRRQPEIALRYVDQPRNPNCRFRIQCPLHPSAVNHESSADLNKPHRQTAVSEKLDLCGLASEWTIAMHRFVTSGP